jgi:hypothetical protein
MNAPELPASRGSQGVQILKGGNPIGKRTFVCLLKQTYICPCFVDGTFVRVRSNVHLSVFYPTFVRILPYVCTCFTIHFSAPYQTQFCPCFTQYLSVFYPTFIRVIPYICPHVTLHFSVFDPTFIRVLPYICPHLTLYLSVFYPTFVRPLSNAVLSVFYQTTSVSQSTYVPVPGRPDVTQQSTLNIPQFRSQCHCRRSARSDSMRIEGAVRNHQPTQLSPTRHSDGSRAE